MPVYAIIMSNIASDWGGYTLLTNIPTYMKEVLKLDITSVSIGIIEYCSSMKEVLKVDVTLISMREVLKVNNTSVIISISEYSTYMKYFIKYITLEVVSYCSILPTPVQERGPKLYITSVTISSILPTPIQERGPKTGHHQK